ncbi:MAG: hypothetical protein U5K31_08505 [Balneolaceae bacterium]|nr:hypothetical protein [Balneolaceae bacterium]
MTAPKYYLALLLFCLAVLPASAQQRTVERTFAMDAGEEVRLELKFGNEITVRAWDRDEVSFTATVEINGGRLNEALLLDFDEEGEGLRIDSRYDNELLRQGHRGDCPDRGYTTYNWSDNREDAWVCSRISYVVHVPRDAPIIIDTISGDILMEGVRGPIEAKSISGFVDLSWPEQQAAQLSLKTISGEAYTDLESLTYLNRKDRPPLVGYELKARIGSSGPAVRLESVSGDIFLRRAS